MSTATLDRPAKAEKAASPQAEVISSQESAQVSEEKLYSVTDVSAFTSSSDVFSINTEQLTEQGRNAAGLYQSAESRLREAFSSDQVLSSALSFDETGDMAQSIAELQASVDLSGQELVALEQVASAYLSDGKLTGIELAAIAAERDSQLRAIHEKSSELEKRSEELGKLLESMPVSEDTRQEIKSIFGDYIRKAQELSADIRLAESYTSVTAAAPSEMPEFPEHETTEVPQSDKAEPDKAPGTALSVIQDSPKQSGLSEPAETEVIPAAARPAALSGEILDADQDTAPEQIIDAEFTVNPQSFSTAYDQATGRFVCINESPLLGSWKAIEITPDAQDPEKLHVKLISNHPVREATELAFTAGKDEGEALLSAFRGRTEEGTLFDKDDRIAAAIKGRDITLMSNINLNSTDTDPEIFTGSRFAKALLKNVTFGKQDLSLSDFGGAQLEGVRFKGTILSGASFKNANLSQVSFSANTLLNYADLRGATVDARTKFPQNMIGTWIDESTNFAAAAPAKESWGKRLAEGARSFMQHVRDQGLLSTVRDEFAPFRDGKLQVPPVFRRFFGNRAEVDMQYQFRGSALDFNRVNVKGTAAQSVFENRSREVKPEELKKLRQGAAISSEDMKAKLKNLSSSLKLDEGRDQTGDFMKVTISRERDGILKTQEILIRPLFGSEGQRLQNASAAIIDGKEIKCSNDRLFATLGQAALLGKRITPNTAGRTEKVRVIV